MRRLVSFAFPAASAAILITIAAFAQQPAPGTRVIQVPMGNGVYYQSSTGWVTLPMKLFLPSYERGAKNVFGFGPSDLRYDLPGLHSPVAVASSRPTFYVRGYHPGMQLQLVRSVDKTGYRKV